MADEHAQLVIIGAGPGGYGAAFEAADLGLDVVLIDPEPDPGGVCLFRGCIPSKALLHIARVIRETREVSRAGVHFEPPEIDVDKLRGWKDSVVQKLTRGVGYLSDQRNIRHIRGRARFFGPYEVEISFEDSDDTRKMTFDQAIIATGSSSVELPDLPFDGRRILSSTEALDLPTLPDHLLVVGGGYIGLEMATAYSAFGSDVTVVEATPDLLPGADRELVKPLSKRLRRQLKEVRLSSKVIDATTKDDRLEVTVSAEGQSEDQTLLVDSILVAVGREPRSGDLGLERTRIEVDPYGFIAVDQERRTTERHIFAIGDVVAEPMLAHKATHEGIIAARVIAGRDDIFAPHAIPAVVFTDPEIAWCGLTERQAEKEGRPIKIGRFPWVASGRAATLGRTEGITKIIADASTHQILGVGICGPHAGELIAEATLAVEMAARAEDLAATIHPHPTLSETLMEAAEDIIGNSTHLGAR